MKIGKKVLVLLISLSCIVNLVGCTDKNPKIEKSTQASNSVKSSEDIRDYFPAKEGYEWRYNNGDQEESVKIVLNKDNQYEEREIYLSGESKNVILVEKDAISNLGIKREDLDKEYILKDGPIKTSKFPFLKAPIEVGNKWEDSTQTFEIFETNASVEVPAGNFTNCVAVKVTRKDSKKWSKAYYKKGIGLVKRLYDNDKSTILVQCRTKDMDNITKEDEGKKTLINNMDKAEKDIQQKFKSLDSVRTSIKISDLDKYRDEISKQNGLSGANMEETTFYRNTLIGATEFVLYGLTTGNKQMLAESVFNSQDFGSNPLMREVSEFQGEVTRNYKNFNISISTFNEQTNNYAVYVDLNEGSVDMQVYFIFKKINGIYYFERFSKNRS